jgi:hypothetical protein
VTLRAPPALDVEIPVQRLDGHQVVLSHAGKVIAEGKPANLDLTPPNAPSFDEAVTASRPGGAQRHPAYEHHVLPECFVCGITRTPGDGLCLWPAPIGDSGHIATTWIPDESVCGATGAVRSEIVWSSLDCPTGLVFQFTEKVGTLILLGRMTGRILKPVQRGERYIVLGWPVGKDDRKFYGGSALYSAKGELHAMAKATWIKVR